MNNQAKCEARESYQEKEKKERTERADNVLY
jgi:hypothetical protein